MDAIETIRRQPGLFATIASELGITRGAVAQWTRIPPSRAHDVSRVTGIPLHKLRPDLWDAPADAA